MKLINKIKKFIQQIKKCETNYITKPLSILKPYDIVYVLAINKYKLHNHYDYLYDLTQPKNLWITKAYVKQINKSQTFEDEIIIQTIPTTKQKINDEIIFYIKNINLLFNTIHNFTTWKYRGYTFYVATDKKQLEKEIKKFMKIIKKLYMKRYKSNIEKYQTIPYIKIMKAQMAQLNFNLNTL